MPNLQNRSFGFVCHECNVLFLLLKAVFLLALCPASGEVVALQLLDPWAAWAEAEGVVVAWWNGYRASIRMCFLLLIVNFMCVCAVSDCPVVCVGVHKVS